MPERYLKLYLNFERDHEPAIRKLIGTEVTGVSLRAWILRQAGVQENVTPPYFADPVNAKKVALKRWKKQKGIKSPQPKQPSERGSHARARKNNLFFDTERG